MKNRSILLQLLVDLCLLALAWFVAFWLRFNFSLPDDFALLANESVWWALGANMAALLVAKVDRQVWRFTGMPELGQLSWGLLLGGVATAALVLMQRYPDFPRSVLVLHPLLALISLGAVRAAWRVRSEKGRSWPAAGRRVLILGTLEEAATGLRAIKATDKWLPMGIVSPLAADVGRSLNGIRVVASSSQLSQAAKNADVSAVLVAAPPGQPGRRQALLEVFDSGVELLTMPRPDQWLQAGSTQGPRKVELEDLLGRDPVQLDVKGLSDLFAGQTVLVTGAGGSIGSELCRQIARLGVACLVCVDVSEVAVYQLERELRASHPQMRGLYYTANVREESRLLAIFQQHKPSVVYHAAAYKHVPLMEVANELEALRTNVIGTLHAARCAGAVGAKRFVMISTDKAVNPTNVMGASKRLAELTVQAVALQQPQTQYVSVRFGNVLGSSGSVVPLFTEQIAQGGPVTVTHPDIVRFFMTIPEAAQLVLQAGLMGKSGQIFVLDMGDPVKIVELARILIRLSGKTEQEIPISYTGLRPGEKLYEELLADDETTEPTPHAKLRVAKTSGAGALDVAAFCTWLDAAGPWPDAQQLRQHIHSLVPEYQAAV